MNTEPLDEKDPLREILGDEIWKYTEIPHKILDWHRGEVIKELEKLLTLSDTTPRCRFHEHGISHTQDKIDVVATREITKRLNSLKKGGENA